MVDLSQRTVTAPKGMDQVLSYLEKRTRVISKNATLSDTVREIKKLIRETNHQAESFASQFAGLETREACRRIWNWCRRHVAYREDDTGKEQLRTPARTLADASEGVDCDCFSIFIACTLTCLKIPYKLRITKNDKPYFQHIYVIVPYGKGHIAVDPVVDAFDYEAPYYEKKDIAMQLEVLSGVPTPRSIDQYDLFIRPQILSGSLIQDRKARAAAAKGMTVEQYDAHMNQQWQNQHGMSPEQWAARQRSAHQERYQAQQQKSAAEIEKLRAELIERGAPVPQGATRSQLLELLRSYPPKSKAGEVLHKVNKANPATVALRTGVLLGMKTNFLKVAEKLRFAYLSANGAMQIGIPLVQYQKLKKVLQRIQKIYHGAGGDVANLKKAILEGRGNQDGRMQSLNGSPQGVSYNIFRPLKWNLGPEFYASEVMPAASLQGLGEVSTASAMSTAAGTMTALAAVLKAVGKLNLKPVAPPVESAASKTITNENNTEIISEGNTEFSPENSNQDSNSPESDPPKRNLKQWAKDNWWGIGLVATAIVAGGMWLVKRMKSQKKGLAGVSESGPGENLGEAEIA